MRLLLKHKLILLILVPIVLLMLAQISHYLDMKEEKNKLINEIIIPHITFLEKSANVQFLTTEIAHLTDKAILYARDGNKEEMLEAIEEIQEYTIQRNENMEELHDIVKQYDSEEGKEALAVIESTIESVDALNQEIITKLITSDEIQKTTEPNKQLLR